jgi:hypothetical protein
MHTRKQLQAPFAHDFQRQPGSDIQRIIALSDCVIAVAFTLLVEEIRFPPGGLNESQLLSYISHSMLPDILLYFVSYIVVASPWISHDRTFTTMKRSNGIFIMLRDLRKLNCSGYGKLDQENLSWRQEDGTDRGDQRATHGDGEGVEGQCPSDVSGADSASLGRRREASGRTGVRMESWDDPQRLA